MHTKADENSFNSENDVLLFGTAIFQLVPNRSSPVSPSKSCPLTIFERFEPHAFPDKLLPPCPTTEIIKKIDILTA